MTRFALKIAPAQQSQLADLCARHLREEEHLLGATLPILHAAKDAFVRRDWASLEKAVHQQQEFDQIIGEVQHRRRTLRGALARYLDIADSEVSLTELLKEMPAEIGGPVQSQLIRMRAQVNEVVTMNHWLAVHVRIHLDAYQQLLRDLTGSATTSSGRYGRGGKAEIASYRPLIEING